MKILILFLSLGITAYSQDELEIPKYEIKLGGANFGLYLSGERYFNDKFSAEIIGTSLFGFINSLHLGPKRIIKKKKLSLWKLGLSGTFVNFNYKNGSGNYWGLSITSEFSRNKFSAGLQPMVTIENNNKSIFFVVLINACYRWSFKNKSS